MAEWKCLLDPLGWKTPQFIGPPDPSWPQPALLITSTHPAAGEAERAAALQVAEARCAAVAGLLDEVQELQGQAEEVRSEAVLLLALGGWGQLPEGSKLTARGPQNNPLAVEENKFSHCLSDAQQPRHLEIFALPSLSR